MAEIRDGPEEPDRENRPEPIPSDDTGAARELVEPRSRAEYSADLERHVALVGFEPRRAGLPDVSIKDATEYLDKRHLERPWLSVARGCPPEVQRLFAALDQGHGHTHIRHEGWVTEEMNEHRVRNLEDPAQLDPAKRRASIDGLTAGNVSHRCGDVASQIIDPKIFAAAFAGGAEHPDVRAALDSKGPRPEPVILPIYNDAYPELIERVRSAAPEDEQIRVFREELREALADPSRLPDDELSRAVQYDDGGSQAFLRRLWSDLYGDEP